MIYICDVRPDLDLIAESTRRLVLALIATERELCVCELVAALKERQPAVSRHLALLREGGWVFHRREGTFVHYRLAGLPPWARQIVEALAAGGADPEAMRTAKQRLRAFTGRPGRASETA
jgi:ArsR family transcriptional regulator